MAADDPVAARIHALRVYLLTYFLSRPLNMAIVSALLDAGEMTAADIRAAVGHRAQYRVHIALRQLRVARVVRIAAWRVGTDASILLPVPHYALGQGADARRPAADPLASNRRWYARNLAAYNLRRRKAPPTPWSGLLIGAAAGKKRPKCPDAS